MAPTLPPDGLQGWLALLLALLVAFAMGYFSRGSTALTPANEPPAAGPAPEVTKLPAAAGIAPAPPALAAAEAAKVAQLRELLVVEQLRECKNMPLDDACLMRYLRARNMDVDKSAAMLKATIDWRHKFGTDDILAQVELIKTEGRTGKTFVAPFRDREGRSVLVLRPRMENTRSHVGNIVHLVRRRPAFCCLSPPSRGSAPLDSPLLCRPTAACCPQVYELERVVASMVADGPAKLFLMIDFKGYSMMNAPPMKTTQETLHILQNHYPERLGKAVLLDAPWLFSGAFRAVTPFIDPVTREKITFLNTVNNEQHVEQLGRLLDRAQVERDLGGLLDTPHFNEASYFDAAADPLQIRASAQAAPTAVGGAKRR